MPKSMRVPQRRAQLLRGREDTDDVIPMTPEGIERLKRQLKDLESQKPQALEAMTFALSLGDFSENAEYHDAKARLARLHSRIFSTTDRLRRAKVLTSSQTKMIQLGSTATVLANGKEKTYQIVTAHESNPTRGRVSNVSPLGAALLGKEAGEDVTVTTEQGATVYHILRVDFVSEE